MAASFNDEGVIVKNTKLGESDSILTIVTRGSGKISAVAKGLRRTKSKFSGTLSLMNRVQFKYTLGKSLDIINEAQIIEGFSSDISKDYDKFLAASQICDIANKITPVTHEPIEQQYLLLIRGLRMLADQLPAGISPNIVTLSYALRSLALSGLEINPEDPTASGLILPQSISSEVALSTLDAMLQGDWTTISEQLELNGNLEQQLTSAIAKYAVFHLESRLRSFD
jgi:DNA repair protein RecO